MLPSNLEIITKIYQWPQKKFPVHSVHFNETTKFIQRADNVRDWYEVVYNGKDWDYEDGRGIHDSTSLLAQTKADAIQKLISKYGKG